MQTVFLWVVLDCIPGSTRVARICFSAWGGVFVFLWGFPILSKYRFCLRPRFNSPWNRGSVNSVAEAAEDDDPDPYADRAPLLLPGSELLDIPESLLEGDWVLPKSGD